MGITISHTLFSPLSMVSSTIGFVSFAFTLGTFFKVFWSNLGTFGAAPQEIQDYLSSLKQGLLEERRHLRRVRRNIRHMRRDRSHGPGARAGSDDHDGNYSYKRNRGRKSGRKKGSRQMHFDRDIQSMRSTGESEALQVLHVTVRDLIKSFRRVEHPFLKAEYQNQRSTRWSNNSHHLDPPATSPYYSEDEASDMYATNRLGHEYKKCGFKERWLWVKRKASVTRLSEVLNRVEVRRTAHEVGEVLSIVTNIGQDLEDMQETMYALEARLNRVVGVRRVE